MRRHGRTDIRTSSCDSLCPVLVSLCLFCNTKEASGRHPFFARPSLTCSQRTTAHRYETHIHMQTHFRNSLDRTTELGRPFDQPPPSMMTWTGQPLSVPSTSYHTPHRLPYNTTSHRSRSAPPLLGHRDLIRDIDP